MSVPVLVRFVCPNGCPSTTETVATAIVTHECRAVKPGAKKYVRLVASHA